MGNYEVHPYAKLLPELSEAENFQLVESIRKHGQLVPVLLYEGKIVDGRSRYNACRVIGIDPVVMDWTPPEDEAGIIPAIIELNLARRHLSLSQRMVVAADALEAMAAQPKRKDPHPVTGKLPEEEDFFGCSKAFAARTFGIDEKLAVAARHIKSTMPELYQGMQAGTVKPEEIIKAYQSRKTDAPSDGPQKAPAKPKPVKRPQLPNPFDSDCLILIPGDREGMVKLSERLENEGYRHQIALLREGKWITEMCKP